MAESEPFGTREHSHASRPWHAGLVAELARIFPPRSPLYVLVLALVAAVGMPIADGPVLDQVLPGLASTLLWGPGIGLIFVGSTLAALGAGTILVLLCRALARILAAGIGGLRRVFRTLRRAGGTNEVEALANEETLRRGTSPRPTDSTLPMLPRPGRRLRWWQQALGLMAFIGWIRFSLWSRQLALFLGIAAMLATSLWVDVWRSIRAARPIPVLRPGWLAEAWRIPFVILVWCGTVAVPIAGLAIRPGPTTIALECSLVAAVAIGGTALGRSRSPWIAVALGAIVLVGVARAVPASVDGDAAVPVALSWLVWVLGLAATVRAASRERREPGELRVLAALAVGAGTLVCAGFVLECRRGAALTELRRVGDVEGIYDLRFDSATRRLYFSNRGGNASVGWIDLDTGELRRPPTGLGGDPQRLALVHGAHTLVVSSPGGASALDLDTLTDYRNLETRNSVDVDVADDHVALLVSEASHDIRSLDLATGERHSFAMPGELRWPYALEWNPELAQLFVSDWMVSPWVSTSRLDGTPLVKRWVGFMNGDTCVLPERSSILVARMFRRRVDELDAHTLERRGSIPVGFGVREIECDRGRGLLMTLDTFRGVLTVHDIATSRALASTQVGSGARAITYDAATGTVYAGASAGIFAWPVASSPGNAR